MWHITVLQGRKLGKALVRDYGFFQKASPDPAEFLWYVLSDCVRVLVHTGLADTFAELAVWGSVQGLATGVCGVVPHG